ncbi:C-terminal binding protein [Rubellimicrobium arenae]|uniref:C-terminal binding protein n=1 Tax=Rubellimicrobium arenae TaxID=2817372 RepID=UPI001B311F95|nr:C-terminal binding protein [Rubellimicrobium arenae]
MKVVVTDRTFPTLDQEERAAREGGAEFAAHQAKTAEEVAEVVAGAHVALVQFAPFTEAAARAMAPGGTVIRYGVGYDNIDLGATRAAGLRVGYVPDYCADEVAEHTTAMALAMLRKLPQLDASVRTGEWAAVKVSRPLKPFAETVFGFFGLGQIGRAVLGRLRGFGFRFAASDPGLSAADAGSLGVELMSAEDLLRRADVISLHAPATAQTRGYFNTERLRTMQPHAILINSARGQLIDENDLAAALRDGTVGGAALDVFGTEPLPPDSPLRSAPNCLLTPHAAWYSDAAIGRLQGLVAEDVTRALNGEGPRKPVPG